MAKFISSVSTDYYKAHKTHEGLQYQSCVFDDKHILYVYEDGGFGKYNPVARVDYAQEDIANIIMEEIDDGTTYRITNLVDKIVKILEDRRGSYTVYNAYSKKRRSSRSYGTIHKGQSEGNARGTDANGSRTSGNERGAKYTLSDGVHEANTENGDKIAGENDVTADREALRRAQQMEQRGKTFTEQVRDLLHNNTSTNNHIYVGETTSILKQLGLNDKPIEVESKC